MVKRIEQLATSGHRSSVPQLQEASDLVDPIAAAHCSHSDVHCFHHPRLVRLVRLVERRSRRSRVSGSVGFVHSLLTKRRSVDFCRLHSSLCRMP